MTAVSKTINTLLKKNKAGFVYSTYYKVCQTSTRPEYPVQSYYEVSQGKVVRWEREVEGNWTSEALN